MKAKNILMSILLVMGSIAAKAANGYPPELALVSQPVMVYNANSITVYYDVENIGDYTYKGSVYLYLDPDEGYYYAKKHVKVRPGSIKRIAIDIPASRIHRGHAFTIMPYYELYDELFSFTTFEYFDPITFFWNGPRNERWVVIHVGPIPHYYNRPGHYRYYYDGFRPPMPPSGHEPRPLDPKHHTYGFHHNNGGYPATHFNEGHGPKPEGGGEMPKPNGNEAPNATVRPKPDGGSMSHGNSHSGGNPPAPNNNGNVRPDRPNSNGASSGRTPNSGSNVGRPSSNSRVGNSSNNSRPSGTTNSSSSGRSGNSSVSRSSSGSSSSTRTASGSSSSRSSSTSSSRTGTGTRGR